ncbi:probable insulin-like peptide 4 [Drosophila ficusphila]|uniref:probable insulin-like peptide 4 n=1 Tax=Drosophila ficusphila TaxID=30025 RepID=UPI0007E60A3E|nr:probable insulin-like peptide 4 [Drosophila ficusphila]
MSTMRLGLALLLLLATASQMWQPVQGRRKMCGEALIEALEMICVNGFSHRVRRSDGAKDRVRALIRKLQQPEEEMETDRESETDTDKDQDRNKETEPPAGRSGRKLRRHRRRIAHECCKEGCTYDDILEYCA